MKVQRDVIETTITQNKSGVWELTFNINGQSRVWFYKTKKEALEKAEKALLGMRKKFGVFEVLK